MATTKIVVTHPALSSPDLTVGADRHDAINRVVNMLRGVNTGALDAETVTITQGKPQATITLSGSVDNINVTIEGTDLAGGAVPAAATDTLTAVDLAAEITSQGTFGDYTFSATSNGPVVTVTCNDDIPSGVFSIFTAQSAGAAAVSAVTVAGGNAFSYNF